MAMLFADETFRSPGAGNLLDQVAIAVLDWIVLL